ncbi:uncharacterized protein LOC131695616 [Topomyia yanbarensis]|uniref:uncharacterized protein LOC131695616 n=1 Tax=Topomyia yanbarensis TaxID=2498891 RepID=UPI00273B3C71|nr:uncharacterized protein LOC131695616 [Topomyia yanbarensis]
MFYSNRMELIYQQADVQRVKKMVENKTVVVHNSCKTRETRKIETLKNRRIATLTRGGQWIENTTNTQIPDFLERTLKLGPNFNVQNNNHIPYVEMISELEKTVKRKENADEIRTEVSTAMINYMNFKKQPRHCENEWISKDICRSKKFLAENPNLVITKADKGNKTVIIASEEYEQKMEDLLSDESTYKQLKSDPTSKVLKKIGVLVDGWRDSKYIDARTHRKIKISSCNPPRVYGLPKIHKQDRPLRPVVSTIGAATYNVAQFLSGVIGNIVGKTEYHIKNSFEFADQITGTQITEDVVLFSLDVTSLYTNVPVDFALDCLNERWEEVEKHTSIDQHSFMEAVKLVLESTCFVHRGVIYAQTFGVPMGSPLSPVIANVVMERLEQKCIASLERKQIPLMMYRRYVDDCFCVGKREHIQEILDSFNNFHSKLQFTIEEEDNGKLRFLDMMLTRNHDRIERVWLPKQADGRYLDFNSESPYSHKCNTAIALVDRAVKLSDCKNRPAAIETAKKILRINHYPYWFVRKILKDRVHKHYNGLQHNKDATAEMAYVAVPYVAGLSEKLEKILRKHDTKLAFKPKDKIKNIIFSKLKDPIPPGKQKNVVYSIPCGTGDGKTYVGQTGRRLETRVAEHKNDAKKKDARTGLAQHTLQEGHIFDFDNTRILERIENQESRLTAEMFHIKILGEEKTVNLQRECGTFCTTYDGLVTKLRQSQFHQLLNGADGLTGGIVGHIIYRTSTRRLQGVVNRAHECASVAGRTQAAQINGEKISQEIRPRHVQRHRVNVHHEREKTTMLGAPRREKP